MKRILCLLVTITISLSSVACHINKEINTETYTMETIYDATEKGFISADGNIWDYEGNYVNGNTYTFLMSDNGTTDKVEDDIMLHLM